MAIKPIDIRLDELNQANADVDQRVELASTSIEQGPQVDDIIEMKPQLGEGVQVAGPVSGVAKVLEETTKGVKKVKIREPNKLTAEASDAAEVQDIAKAAEAAGVATPMEAKVAAKMEVEKDPNLTPDAFMAEKEKVAAQRAGVEAATEVPPKTQFNLPRMETIEDVKSTIEALNNLSGLKTKKITFEDVKAKAQEAGIGIKFFSELTSGKLKVDPTNTFKALDALTTSATKLSDMSDIIAKGNPPPELLAEFAQMVHFHSVLQQSVKGYQTNIAQSLAVMRIPRTGTADMADILADFGSDSDIIKFAQAYRSLTDPMARAKMIASKAQGNPWEKLFTVYVNGLLSRPTTHIKNALSNTVFMPWRLTERAIAAGIGKVRRTVGLGSEDAYRINEVSAIFSSTPVAFKNGFQLAAEAFKTGVPKGWTDPSKIAKQQSRMQLFNVKDNGSLASAALRGLNFVATLPGRSLMTADEFFKGINYTHELSAEATRLGIKEFEDAVKAGKTVAEAETVANDAVTKFLAEPPDYIAGLAEVGTFTQKLEGNLGKTLQGINPSSPQGFLIRTQMPFIGTPVNIMAETVARTPLGVFSKPVLAALNPKNSAKFGKEADMALAKVGMGSSAMYMLSGFAHDNKLTGSGPGDKGTREAMIRQGWQPYSMVFDMIDMDDITRAAIASLPTSVTYGSGDYKGKIYISYQGMEPVGALMAMAADYVDYVKYEGDDDEVNAVFGGLAFGFGSYMLDSPFLQGINNLNQIFFGGGSGNDKKAFVNQINMIGKTFGEVGRKSITPLSGAITSLKEKTDPVMRDYKADPNMPAGLKGLMEAFNKMRSETPGLSSSLPPKLNIWGETTSYEYAYAPWRMKEGKLRETDQMLIALNANVSMPSRSFNAQDSETKISAQIKLTTEEYNEMIRIANQELFLEDKVLAVVESIKDDDGASDPEDYKMALKKPFEDTFAKAREILLKDSKFSSAMQERLAKSAKKIKEFR